MLCGTYKSAMSNLHLFDELWLSFPWLYYYLLSYPYIFIPNRVSFAFEFDFLLLFYIYQNRCHQRSYGSHIPRPRDVKIAFGEFTRSINSDALQWTAQQSLSIRYISYEGVSLALNCLLLYWKLETWTRNQIPAQKGKKMDKYIEFVL